ncbi:B12-binding domain-containing radical SAM protein [Candidatus Omnitrophota bacterium]
MKISFIRPPFYSLLNAVNYKLNTYPLHLSYLAACAKQEGHEIDFVDGEASDINDILKEDIDMQRSEYVEFTLHDNVKRIDEIMQNSSHAVWKTLTDKILATKPDVIGVTCYSSSMNSVKIICNNIKRRDKGITVVLGGIHPTSLPEHSLKYTGADIAVIGEGELTLSELLRVLKSGNLSKLNQVKGIAYKDAGGNIIFNERRSYIDNLDSVPFPERDFFDKELYSGDVISTSRGCPFRCNYCASKVMWQKKVRFRSVENIIAELEILKDRYDSKFVRIVDDTFTLNKKRVLNLCRNIQERGLNSIRFSIGSRVDMLDDEVAEALKKSGVETVTLGIESASPNVLKFIGKDETLDDMAKSISILKTHDIQSHTFFMIGFPGETKEDILMSKNFVAKYKPDYVEVNMVTPYPGTELWDMMMKDREYSVNNWYQRFHQGLPSCSQTNYDLNEEYESFLKFTKDINVRGVATTTIGND